MIKRITNLEFDKSAISTNGDKFIIQCGTDWAYNVMQGITHLEGLLSPRKYPIYAPKGKMRRAIQAGIETRSYEIEKLQRNFLIGHCCESLKDNLVRIPKNIPQRWLSGMQCGKCAMMDDHFEYGGLDHKPCTRRTKCFICGSAEHKGKKCPSNRDDNFTYFCTRCYSNDHQTHDLRNCPERIAHLERTCKLGSWMIEFDPKRKQVHLKNKNKFKISVNNFKSKFRLCRSNGKRGKKGSFRTKKMPST